MAIELASLIVKLGLVDKQFESGIGRSIKDLKRLDDQTFKLSSSLKNLGASLLAGFAVSAVWSELRSLADELDVIGKRADKLGISTQSFQELEYAASQTGVNFQTMSTSMQRLMRRSADAAKGNKGLADSFADLGIDAEKIAKLPVDQQLRAVADGLLAVEDHNERVRLAFRLFDSEGVALVNTLKNGSAGLDEYAKQAQQLGLVVGDDSVRAAESFNDQLDNLDRQFNVIKAQSLPQIVTGLQWMTGALKNVIDFAGKARTGFMAMMRDSLQLVGASEAVLEDFNRNIEKRIELHDKFARSWEQAQQATGDDVSLDTGAEARQQAFEEAQKESEKARQSIDAYISKLEEEARAHEMGAKAAERLNFVRQKGVLSQDVAKYDAAMERIEKGRAEDEANAKRTEQMAAEQQRLERFAARITESLETPGQKLDQFEKQLRESLGAGLIDYGQFQAALDNERERLFGQPEQQVAEEPRFRSLANEAVDFTASNIARLRREFSEDRERYKQEEAARKEAAKQTGLLTEIADNTRTEVVSFPSA